MTAVRLTVPGQWCERCASWWPQLWRIVDPRCPECGDPLQLRARPRGWVHVRDQGTT